MLRAHFLNSVEHFLDLLHIRKVYGLFDTNNYDVRQRLGIWEDWKQDNVSHK
jgi:hypothetical protein